MSDTSKKAKDKTDKPKGLEESSKQSPKHKPQPKPDSPKHKPKTESPKLAPKKEESPKHKPLDCEQKSEEKKPQPKEKKEEEKIPHVMAAPGEFPNEIQFPSPLYVSQWLDNRHVVIGGGGGGQRFGMLNALVLLQVPGDDNSKGKMWKAVDHEDLGGDIVWCMSSAIADISSTSNTISKLFCISHKDAFSVVRYSIEEGATSAKIERLVRCPLYCDEENPDKKCISFACANSKSPAVLVAQDNETIAAFSLADVLKNKLEPLGLIGSGSQASGGLKFGGRITDMSLSELPSGEAILVVVSQDKKCRVCHMRALCSGISSQLIVRYVELDEERLRIPFSLMTSSLRLCVCVSPKILKPSKAEDSFMSLVVSYDPRTGKSYITGFPVGFQDGKMKIDTSAFSISEIVPDAVTGKGVVGRKMNGAASFLFATAEGTVFELECKSDGKCTVGKMRKEVHREPISSIAVQPIENKTSKAGEESSEEAPIVLTTDIAQRCIISQLGTKKRGEVLQFPDIFTPKSQRGSPLKMMLFIVFVAASIAYAMLFHLLSGE